MSESDFRVLTSNLDSACELLMSNLASVYKSLVCAMPDVLVEKVFIEVRVIVN